MPSPLEEEEECKEDAMFPFKRDLSKHIETMLDELEKYELFAEIMENMKLEIKEVLTTVAIFLYTLHSEGKYIRLLCGELHDFENIKFNYWLANICREQKVEEFTERMKFKDNVKECGFWISKNIIRYGIHRFMYSILEQVLEKFSEFNNDETIIVTVDQCPQPYQSQYNEFKQEHDYKEFAYEDKELAYEDPSEYKIVRATELECPDDDELMKFYNSVHSVSLDDNGREYSGPENMQVSSDDEYPKFSDYKNFREEEEMLNLFS